jgi:hypothetical protein
MIHAAEMAFKSIDLSGPEPTQRRRPVINLLKRFRVQPAETTV